MPFQSVPECAVTVVHAQIDGQNVFNVLNWWKPGGYLQSDIDALALGTDTQWASNVLPILHTSYVYSQVEVRGLVSAIDLSAVSSVGAGAGAVGGDSLPNNVAFVVTEKTGHTGRSARGRVYVGGIPASATATQNTVTSLVAADLVGALQAIAANNLANGWHLTIVSRIAGGVRRAVGIHTEVTQILARNVVLDSQRNRLPPGH